jgi:hypothetical protein
MTLTTDPDLHLVIDGVPRRAQWVDSGVYTFSVASVARWVIIASRSVVPLDIGGADARRLGVPVHRVVLRGGGDQLQISPQHLGLTDGFNDDEGTHRWTNGWATLPSKLLARFSGEVTIELHIGTIELEYPA